MRQKTALPLRQRAPDRLAISKNWEGLRSWLPSAQQWTFSHAYGRQVRGFTWQRGLPRPLDVGINPDLASHLALESSILALALLLLP